MRRPVSPAGLRIPCGVTLLGSLLLVSMACGGRGSVATDDHVAQVGDFTISRSELDLYLALNLLPRDGDASVDPEGVDRVKSRLLDAFVNEKTYLIEAARRGIEVTESEIDVYLGTDVEDDPVVDVLTAEQRRQLVRQRLSVQKLQEQHAAGLPAADENDLRKYIENSRGRLAPRKRVRLRALRFDSAEQAKQTAREIRRGRLSFPEAVATFEKDPGQGVLIEMSWDALSPGIRAALEGLEPLEVSSPLDFNGETILFQVHSWLTDPAQMEQELIRRARGELERLRRRRGSEELLLSLRSKTPVVIHEERLPFHYVR